MNIVAIPKPEDYENARKLLEHLSLPYTASDELTIVSWLVSERQKCLNLIDQYAHSTSRTVSERSLARLIAKRIQEVDW